MTIEPQLIYVRIDQRIITNENIQIGSHFQRICTICLQIQRRIFNGFNTAKGQMTICILIIYNNLNRLYSIKLIQSITLK